MYRISPFTPLFFNPSTDQYGAASKYVQIFAPTDQILIEVIAVSEYREIKGAVIDAVNESETAIDWSVWVMNDTTILYYYVLSGLKPGFYYLDINDAQSELFRVTDDTKELAKTTLIQYSMKDNKQRRDGVFWISEKQYFFDFRAPGGFKDDNWTFGVANEQFVTIEEDLVDLYSIETTQKSFTLGNSIGCPVWYAELLNRIMSCSYVYFDNQRYVRKDGSVPEKSQEIENLRSYIFNMILQEVKHVDKTESDNLLKIRRVEGTAYRLVENKLLIV